MKSVLIYLLEFDRSKFERDEKGANILDTNPETGREGIYQTMGMIKAEAVKHLNNKAWREPGFLYNRYKAIQNQKNRIANDTSTEDYVKESYKKYLDDPKSFGSERTTNTNPKFAL